MTTAATTPSARPAAAAAELKGIRIYEYSDLVYWWAIWFAALVCIVATATLGDKIPIGDKAVMVYQNPWLGIGFLIVMFATLIFSQLRARGIYAVIMVLAVALIALSVHNLVGWAFIWDQVILIKIYMNQAYYVATFVVTFAIWLYVTFIHARLTYGIVNPGEIGWHSPLTGQVETYKPLNFQAVRRSDDLIVHKILGLRFLGLGTGDIEVKFDVPGGGSQSHVFKNVWRPNAKIGKLDKLISEVD
jgi:hypothetical protein